MMDQDKTKDELLEELLMLRGRVAELEAAHPDGKRAVIDQIGRTTRYLVDGKYGIRDLVDLDALGKVFRAFSAATGFTTGLIDFPMQKVLIATGWREICAKFHRAFPDSLRRCKKSNALLTEKLISQKRQSINECENGLIDAATPIIIKGVHIASIKTGQVFFGRPHLEYYRRQAESFGYDPEEYLESLAEVPVVSESQLQSALQFLNEFATMIVELGMNNLEIRETLSEFEEEIQERIRTEESLKRSKDDLRRLSSQLLTAQEEEKNRIAEEIHECIGSGLEAIRLELETAREDLTTGATGAGNLARAMRMVEHTMNQVTRIRMDLRPAIIEDTGLLPALDGFSRHFMDAHKNIHITCEFDVEESEIPESLKIVIFRVVQDACANIAIHSSAGSAAIVLSKNKDMLELVIRDDGRGFEPRVVLSSAERGIGLACMRERVGLSGGTFSLDAAPGEGVKVTASWKCEPRKDTNTDEQEE
ncbi:MAG: PocR ligand-binding domain-containing protein [Syntrophobacteraceae bacterium]